MVACIRAHCHLNHLGITINYLQCALILLPILSSRFSIRQICSHEQRIKQLNWLVTNTDDITTQSHSLLCLFAQKNRQVGNELYIFQHAFNIA